MILVKDIEVTDKFGLEFLHVEFRIQDTHENLDNYIFDVYKSYHQTEGFELIQSDIKDFYVLDYDVNLYDNSKNYYYKIKVIDKNSGKELFSDVLGEYRSADTDCESQGILEIHKKYLSCVVKQKMILLKRKRNGQLCECYDDVRKRANPTNCYECYGTNYVGGYYTPYVVDVNFANVSGKREGFDYTEVGEEENPLQLWTNNYPFIQIGDILIDRNNTRYIVMTCQPSYKNFFLLRQTVQVSRVPKSNVVYSVAVDPNIKLY